MNFSMFHWNSLKTRVTLFTLTIFLVSIWSLAFYSGRMLREMSIGNDSRRAARWAERVERFENSASHCGDYSLREHKLIVHAYKGMRKSG